MHSGRFSIKSRPGKIGWAKSLIKYSPEAPMGPCLGASGCMGMAERARDGLVCMGMGDICVWLCLLAAVCAVGACQRQGYVQVPPGTHGDAVDDPKSPVGGLRGQQMRRKWRPETGLGL